MNKHWRTKITVIAIHRDLAGLLRTVGKSPERKRIRYFDQEQPSFLIELYRNSHRMEGINCLEKSSQKESALSCGVKKYY